MDEVTDALPVVALLIGPQPGASRRDASLWRDADHLGHDQAGAAERLGAQVGQVEVAGHPVYSDIHVHRGNDHAVDQLELTEPERVEHRRPDLTVTVSSSLFLPGEPGVDIGNECGVAQPQVVIGDAPASGEDVEGELLRLLIDILLDVLEPLQAGLGRALRRQHHGLSLFFVCCQGGADVIALVQARCEGERILHRELRARTDREVRGMGGIAEQHHVVVHPVLVADRGETDPAGVVGQHFVAVEDVGEQLADRGDRLLVGLPRCEGSGVVGVEAGPLPHLIGHLHDEGAAVLVERVAVHLHDPVRGLADVEGEGLEHLVGAEPHVAAAADVEGRLELFGIRAADG